MKRRALVTSEYVPAGIGCPPWLFEAFSTPERHSSLLILHPTELHRQQVLERLHDSGVAVSPQHHLTLNGLVRQLHTDLRLPVLLDDETSAFMALHARCAEAAENAALPFLFTPGVGSWTLTKTRRLQRLHGELLQLREPFAWEGDPGAAFYHELCLDYEKTAGGTLPALLTRHVLTALETSEAAPFHLQEVSGIIMLNSAPDLTEIEQNLLLAISAFTPVHQLLNPGSFRLGHHGAYLVDEQPITQAELPSWVPDHEVWSGGDDGWQTDVGRRHQTQITRLTLDDRSHAVSAALTMIKTYRETNDGAVLVVDAAARDRPHIWSKALKSIGMNWQPGSARLDLQPMHRSIVRAANLAQGMNAWSLEALRAVFFSSTMPFVEDMFPEQVHPERDTYRPRPDPGVLGDLARQFHVLGGPGAIARWLGVLSVAEPSFSERNPEARAQALEETQWWLGCLLHAWAPLLPNEERYLLRRALVGCTTGQTLPTPSPMKSGMAWLSWLLGKIDVAKLEHRRAPFDAGFGAVQRFVEALNAVKHQLHSLDLPFPDEGHGFIDTLEHVGATTDVPHRTSRTDRINVVSPDDALGCTADLLLLVGLDVDAWPMRSPTVPWLDAQAQLELGLFQTDRLVRRGRHHLRHLLNAGRHVIVFDSSPEEGGGPCAPLAEWLEEVKRNRSWDTMRAPPSFLPPELYQGEEGVRPFRWVSREDGHGSWLAPALYSHEATPSGLRRVRHGFAGRDRRQQLGIDLQLHLQSQEILNNSNAVLHAFESGIQADRRRRQPHAKRVPKNQTFDWELRHQLASIDAVTLRPTRAALSVSGVAPGVFPHLGHREEKSISVTVDPRPLPPYGGAVQGLEDRFGDMQAPLERSVWSPSRLEAWLKCPRQAWMNQFLRAADDEELTTEDIDVRIRGQVVHDAEAAIMEGHGIPFGEEYAGTPLPLHLGPMGQGRAGWDAVLDFLEQNVHWLGRNNAVSVHRTRDLIDASPELWQAHQDGEVALAARGRLARLLEADLSLHNSAPVALEWAMRTETDRFVELDTEPEESDGGLRVFGYADRVDVLVLNETQRIELEEKGIIGDDSHDTPFPLHGEPRSAQRLVVIRDLKTVAGPPKKLAGLRHMRCLFEDLQLALYARAWELLHPNDRVVGVGGSEVGEFTRHYVELDSDIMPLKDSLEIGEVSDVFPKHFPAETRTGHTTTPFRRWMAERLAVAQRAISTAGEGVVNPTPGKHCSYCSIAHSCAVSDYTGGAFS